MMGSVTGGCFCGAVRFQFDHLPLATRVCWCRDCQYLSSGNASVNAVFRAAGLTSTGTISVGTISEGAIGEFVSRADSGNTMRRRFCPQCGTPLFSQSSARPHLIVVRAGTLDDPELARPGGVIWSASAPSWAFGLSDLERCTGQPPPARLDPAGGAGPSPRDQPGGGS
jgi:hypothetical protein